MAPTTRPITNRRENYRRVLAASKDLREGRPVEVEHVVSSRHDRMPASVREKFQQLAEQDRRTWDEVAGGMTPSWKSALIIRALRAHLNERGWNSTFAAKDLHPRLRRDPELWRKIEHSMGSTFKTLADEGKIEAVGSTTAGGMRNGHHTSKVYRVTKEFS